jgi:hypothetical protein
MPSKIIDKISDISRIDEIELKANDAVLYKGPWDADTNTPDVANSSPTKGDYYVVSVAGSTNVNGITEWDQEDWVIYDGTNWKKIDHFDGEWDKIKNKPLVLQNLTQGGSTTKFLAESGVYQSNVLTTGSFTSEGFLFRDGAGDYTTDNTLILDGDFSNLTEGFLTKTAAGAYEVVVDNLLKDSDFSNLTAGFLKKTADETYEVDDTVLVDGDFSSAGWMKSDGSGNYSMDNTVVNDADFSAQSAGYLKKTGAGSYTVVNETYANISGDVAQDFNANNFTAVAITETSDKKYKDNIETINNALEKALALRGVTYTLKESDKTEVGFIAQEVQEVLPEVVHERDGDLSVSYQRVVALLVESIKDLQQQINELKGE